MPGYLKTVLPSSMKQLNYHALLSDFSGLSNGRLQFTFRKLSEADLSRYPVFSVMNRFQRYMHNMRHGHLCYGFFTSKNDLASYLWISLGSISDLVIPYGKLRVALSDQQSYIWDCRTIPDFQRKGLYIDGLCIAKQICVEHGATDIYISADPANVPSQRRIMSAGFKPCGEVKVITLGAANIIHTAKGTWKVAKKTKPIKFSTLLN